MSDFFAGVYGAKFPEVVMNSGPLPPQGGLPAPCTTPRISAFSASYPNFQ